MITMNEFIADELSDKVHHLSQALKKAEDIILLLEEQNNILLDALNNLASENNRDYAISNEVCGGNSYAM